MLAFVVATLAAATFVGRAEAFVFWTESAINTIGRANLDGTGVNLTFIGAFINEVRAQTDRKVDGDLAAKLIAESTAVRQLLSCSAE